MTWPETARTAPAGTRGGRWPEVSLVAAGVLLRLSLYRYYDVHKGYDFGSHWLYVAWFAKHWALAPLDLSRASYHPPLYHALAGLLLRLRADVQQLGLISIVCGCLRLLVIWAGLELVLPGRRLARCFALAVAAFLPSSVHLDGMMTNEGLNCLLAAVAMLLTALLWLPGGGGSLGSAERGGRSPAEPPLIDRDLRWRWRWALLLGGVLGLELLTKVSALALVLALGAAAGLEFALRGDGGLAGRARRLLPLIGGLAVLVGVAGWYSVHNQRLYGKPFPSGFDGPERGFLKEVAGVPYLKRRPPDFAACWSNDIYVSPYWPAGTAPRSCFFPVLVASTFVDYYNYGFAPPPPPGLPPLYGNRRPLRRTTLLLSRASAAGGTVLALGTAFAWVGVLVHALRRRRFGLLALLLMPFGAMLGQLHFAVMYPFDIQGPVKGLYMQFAAPPLYGLAGVAVDRLWSWPALRPAVVLFALALVPVIAYTLYCRIAPIL